jgi:hypothetical protein
MQFVLTTNAIAALAGCTPAFALKMARAGRIRCQCASNGTNLFTSEDSAVLRRLKTEAIARRYGRAANVQLPNTRRALGKL